MGIIKASPDLTEQEIVDYIKHLNEKHSAMIKMAVDGGVGYQFSLGDIVCAQDLRVTIHSDYGSYTLAYEDSDIPTRIANVLNTMFDNRELTRIEKIKSRIRNFK